MKKFLLLFFLAFSISMQSQCFDCAKNYGGWNDDTTADLKKASDGIYLAKNGFDFGSWMSIYKYDFNCNLLWKKEIDERDLYISKIEIDNQDNLYVLFTWPDAHNVPGPFPIVFSGMPIYPGLNLIKFDKNGNFIWNRSIGSGADYGMRDIFIYNDLIYITGTFFTDITINNQTTLTNTLYTGYYVYHPLLFIATFDFNGNLKDAQKYGTGNDDYTSSEMDKNGNLYFSRYSNSNSNYTHSNIDKIDSNLNLIWSREISNNKTKKESAYRPTLLHYNPNNDKLYLWGSFYKTADILGTIYVDPGNGSYLSQSILSEFNATTGDLERIKQINNASNLDLPGINGSSTGNTAYLAEKGNELYIFSSFTGTMEFPNAVIKTKTYNGGGGPNDLYNIEELVLFKVNLNSFDLEFILQPSGKTYYSNGMSTDAANPILFNGNDLFLTASFESSPLTINGSVINNNSGNSASDVMFYKYKLDSANNSGEIIAKNTCFNTPTKFNINGNFDSIVWDFDDPTSSSNSATISNPEHQFLVKGTYHVTANVTCGNESQLIEKDIEITDMPQLNQIAPIIECETISGSGICSTFDTSNINSLLIGNQQNITLEFKNANGTVLPSPLPNPYTNTNIGGDLITVRSFYANNPNCFVETKISFNTLPKPLNPITTSPQNFCIQQNASINNLVITGQDIKWYDVPMSGNSILNTTVLQNGLTYYASQTVNGCESSRFPILVNIQNTPAPIGNANQSFCAAQNATLNEIQISGTNLIWYPKKTNSTKLPISTLLVNGTKYFATQTINGCESVDRFEITIALISTLNANNYTAMLCDDLNDGSENINLSDYNSKLIPSISDVVFTYYSSNLGAENQNQSDKLNNNYKLTLGLQMIYVRIDSNNGCHQIVTLTLELVAKPNITINDIVPICEGKPITVLAGIGADSYLWSTGATSQTIVISLEGDYSVTATKNYGAISCSSTKNFSVKNSQTATIKNIEIKDWTTNDNQIIVYTTETGDFEYSIDGTNFQDSNQFSNLASGDYTVTVRDKYGCGTAIEEVYILMYPKFFTPNQDGYNDTWSIKNSEKENLVTKIFDRYGKLIIILQPNQSWDGTLNGKNLPSTDYWFVVTRANGKEYKGHFALKR